MLPLDIELEGLIKGLANNPRDPSLGQSNSVGRSEKINQWWRQLYRSLLPGFWRSNPGYKLAPLFANSNRNKLKFESSDGEVIAICMTRLRPAMKQTFQVLTKRIDKFGVSQPNIQLDENKGIISVELAGATDPDRVRKYLQSSANLQFWEVYNISEFPIRFKMQIRSYRNT